MAVSFFFVSEYVALALAVPYVVSAVLPARGFPRLLSSWFFRCALKLHDYEQVRVCLFFMCVCFVEIMTKINVCLSWIILCESGHRSSPIPDNDSYAELV